MGAAVCSLHNCAWHAGSGPAQAPQQGVPPALPDPAGRTPTVRPWGSPLFSEVDCGRVLVIPCYRVPAGPSTQ